MQVVLAGPGDLDRRAVHGLRAEARLDHEVGLRLAAEAAAEQGHVDRHLLVRQTEALGEPRARRLRRLRAGPGLARAVDDAHQRRRRLHRRLGEMRNVVLGRDALCRLRPSRASTSPSLRTTLPGLRAASLSSRAIGVGGIDGVRAVVPGDLQLVAPLDRRPGVAGDHGDAAERLELGRDRRADRCATTLTTPGTFRASAASYDATLPP